VISAIWFKAFVGLSSHRKLRRLSARTAGELVRESAAADFAVGVFFWFRLLETAAKYARPTGILEGVLTPEELEHELGWSGAAGELVRTMVELRLLEERPLRVHEWRDYQPQMAVAEQLGEMQRRRAEAAPAEEERDPSPMFLRWWSMVPSGKKKAVGLCYQAWCRQALDGGGPASDALRAEVYTTFAQQIENETWRRGFIEKGSALSYMRRADWRFWRVARPPANNSTVEVPILSLPQRADEQDLQRDWAAIPGNADRKYPGYDTALAELMANAGKKRN